MARSKQSRPKKAASPLSDVRFMPPFESFVMLHGLFEDAAGIFFSHLLEWMKKPDVPQTLPEGTGLYRRLWRAVVETQEFLPGPRVGDALQDHFLERLLDHPNPLHRKAELAPLSQIGS